MKRRRDLFYDADEYLRQVSDNAFRLLGLPRDYSKPMTPEQLAVAMLSGVLATKRMQEGHL